MNTRIVLAILLALTSPAFARIGETEAQIEKRFGKSLKIVSVGNEPIQKAYERAGLYVIVSYIDGISQLETYSKKDKSGLSDNEIAVLLAANAPTGKWIEDPKAAIARLRAWALESSDRTAAYKSGILMVETAAMKNLTAQRRAEAEKEKLKGF